MNEEFHRLERQLADQIADIRLEWDEQRERLEREMRDIRASLAAQTGSVNATISRAVDDLKAFVEITVSGRLGVMDEKIRSGEARMGENVLKMLAAVKADISNVQREFEKFVAGVQPIKWVILTVSGVFLAWLSSGIAGKLWPH